MCDLLELNKHLWPKYIVDFATYWKCLDGYWKISRFVDDKLTLSDWVIWSSITSGGRYHLLSAGSDEVWE